MVGYQYSYLIGGCIFLLIWIFLFKARKDLRKEMLIISVLFGCAGLIMEAAYVLDWWAPKTITNTKIGIEDFLFGFAVGGIASSIYEEVFKKKFRKRKENNKKRTIKTIESIIILLSLAIIFFPSFYLLKLNSLWSTILAFGIPTTYMLYRRRDLIIDSIFSGILLVIVSIFVFILMEILNPGWIDATWKFEVITKLKILKVPLEDLLWFFFAGAFIGPLYEYWKEGKLINYKRQKSKKRNKK